MRQGSWGEDAEGPTVLEFLDKDTGQHGSLCQKAAVFTGLVGSHPKAERRVQWGLVPLSPNMVAHIFTGYFMAIGLRHQGYTDAIRLPGH